MMGLSVAKYRPQALRGFDKGSGSAAASLRAPSHRAPFQSPFVMPPLLAAAVLLRSAHKLFASFPVS